MPIKRDQIAHNGLVAGSSPAGPTTMINLWGHFENDSISALRTTRFRFENDSIAHLPDKANEFRLDFFVDFWVQKNRGGSFLCQEAALGGD